MWMPTVNSLTQTNPILKTDSATVVSTIAQKRMNMQRVGGK